MYLLDTNVVSETRKIRFGKADAHVLKWANAIDNGLAYLSAITVQEIEIGVRRMERRDPEQGMKYRAWLEREVLPVFQDRILPVDILVARMSAAFHVPDPAPFRDGLIGATAKVHNLILVTRNTADFQRCGVPLLNPWQPD